MRLRTVDKKFLMGMWQKLSLSPLERGLRGVLCVNVLIINLHVFNTPPSPSQEGNKNDF